LAAEKLCRYPTQGAIGILADRPKREMFGHKQGASARRMIPGSAYVWRILPTDPWIGNVGIAITAGLLFAV
jgi:hypothetical protein